jgi:hypothetical protein
MERFIAEWEKESDAIGKIAEVFHVEHSRFTRITMRILKRITHSTAWKAIKFGDAFLSSRIFG